MNKIYLFMSIFAISCTPTPVQPTLPVNVVPKVVSETLQERRELCDKLFNHILNISAINSAGEEFHKMTSEQFNEHKKEVFAEISNAGIPIQFGFRCLGLMTKDGISCNMKADSIESMTICNSR